MIKLNSFCINLEKNQDKENTKYAYNVAKQKKKMKYNNEQVYKIIFKLKRQKK